jgi:hypothetical protein
MIENQRDFAARTRELQSLPQLVVFEAELEVQATLADRLDALHECGLCREAGGMALDVVADASHQGYGCERIEVPEHCGVFGQGHAGDDGADAGVGAGEPLCP